MVTPWHTFQMSEEQVDDRAFIHRVNGTFHFTFAKPNSARKFLLIAFHVSHTRSFKALQMATEAASLC